MSVKNYTYNPTAATVNKLNELGYKIFLDRYALKDGTKKSLKVGDIVIVCVDLGTSQREIGVVEKIELGQITVTLRSDGTKVTRAIEHIDKPLETDPAEMHNRIAAGIAGVEKSKDLQQLWEKKFKQAMTDFKFVPAGRILTGAGTNQALTYYNCYVIPSPHDSRGGIFKTLSQMAEIMSRGGGVGINLSSLRPRYDYVKGVNGRSSGSVSWGSLYSFVTGLIEQGGSRRGALMLILNIWHPDVLEFITSKTEMGKITNANISIGITDDFMAAVKTDQEWNLIFPDKTDPDYDLIWDGNLNHWQHLGKKTIIYKTVRAKDLWDKIIQSAWTAAEPGLFFIDRYNKMSPSAYFAPILCTNPCGEQGLPAWGVCNLGAINLAAFVDEEREIVQWQELGEVTATAVRFLDNVIDATPYFFQENELQQKSERRVGLNTMGLAEMMIKLKLRYGSTEGNKFIDKLYRFIVSRAYATSAQLAKEKGAFSKFQTNKHLNTGFVNSLPQPTKALIKKYGLRNVTLTTQAPNGTIGTMVGTSTGIEPFYYWSYERRSRLGLHEERVAVYEAWLKAHPTDKTLPDYFVTAMDLAPEEHIGVQATIQRWIDSSISKTCNVPNHYTQKQVGELYRLMYDLGCKGGTIYRDGSRDVQVLTHQSEEKNNDSVSLAALSNHQSSTVAALVSADGIVPRKRPETMKGTTYKVSTAYGNMYLTINDDENGRPYEVFTALGKTGGFFAAKTEAISRLISLALRSGVSVNEVIDQLKGIRGPNPTWDNGSLIFSIPDAIASILLRHIDRRQTRLDIGMGNSLNDNLNLSSLSIPAKNVSNQNGEILKQTATLIATKTNLANLGTTPICPQCGNMLIAQEGCLSCTCGYSKCG